MPHRSFILAAIVIHAILLRAAVGQQGPSQNQPPPGPFSGGRSDPYFPKANTPQRIPIVNQPAPPPKLGNFSEEPEETSLPGFRQPVLREFGVENGESETATADELNEFGDRFEPGKIVARIGNQVILYGDVASLVDQDMMAGRSQITNKYQQAEFNSIREQRIRATTRQLAEKKLQYVEFLRTMAQKAKDKMAEAEKDINKNVKNAFEKGLDEMREKMAKATTRKEIGELMQTDIVLPRLALLMKENNLETRAQLDEKLRSHGSSMEKQVAMFREHNLGQSAVIEKIKKQPEVTHEDMLEYYRKNAEKFAIPAKAQFELLSIYFSRSEGRTEEEKKATADRQIRSMGNAVFFGTPFPEVAKKFSHEANASQGGLYESISKGSLASEAIDAAVFSLPLKRLSPILEDERGYHIVRVMERSEARQTPFEEAQKEIKEKIKKERRDAKIKEVLESLKKATPIWTIYDEDEPEAATQQAVAKPATSR